MNSLETKKPETKKPAIFPDVKGLEGSLRRAFLIKVIFSFWGRCFLIESELLFTFNSVLIYFSGRLSVEIFPEYVYINQGN
jgi:hypothetical protein